MSHSSDRYCAVLGAEGVGLGRWHNNHHRYGASARAGFAWYEIDLTYYLLKLLAMLGIIRDLRDQLPDDVREEGGLAPAASKVGDLR